MKILPVLIAALLLSACEPHTVQPYGGAESFSSNCKDLPREANVKLPLSALSDDWFQVYEAADGVYSIVEPYHFQETVSHLIIGSDAALLFDTGMGFLPIRPLVEALTDRPIIVLNSHSHYDHVGGNAEFDTVLAMDSDYTRANMRGFEHARLAEDFVPAAFCKGVPSGVALDGFKTRKWQATEFITDGYIVDLGDRQLQVLHVSGHTPDAVALLDEANRLLFTGDSYYDAPIWLFVPETNLAAYEESLERLETIEREVDYLFGAHNVARMDSGRIAVVRRALQKVRAGDVAGDASSGYGLMFRSDGIEFITTQDALDGSQSAGEDGGSGLDNGS